MKQALFDLVKKVFPYKRLPKGLKRLVAAVAFTNKPKYVSSVEDAIGTLNCVIAFNKYGGYAVPLSSRQRPVAQQILKGRVHEQDTIDCVLQHCGNGDVIHAGTYFGDFLPALSKGLSPGARIWAYEPNAENSKCAEITLLLNDLKNISLKHAGLGAANSLKKLLIQTNDGTNLGGTSRIVSEAGDGKITDVNILSIDSEIPRDRNVTVIQLDVEGYEKEVLKGALETIKRCKPVLIMEINNVDLTQSVWLKENILSLGYNVAGRVHMNSVLKPL